MKTVLILQNTCVDLQLVSEYYAEWRKLQMSIELIWCSKFHVERTGNGNRNMIETLTDDYSCILCFK